MHIESWYITILLYFVASTSFSIIQSRVARTSKQPLNLVAAIMYVLVAYPIALAFALLYGNITVQWSWHAILLLIGIGLTIGSFNSLTVRLNKHVDATQYIIINNLYTPVTVILGVLVIHEAFTKQQFFGMALLIAGAIIVAAKGFTRQTFRFSKYTVYCALASLLLGVGLVFERAALNHMSVSAYLILGWGMQGLVALLLAGKQLPHVKRFTRDDWVDVLKLGLARSGQNLGFVLSVALSRSVALIATVSSFRVTLVFIAGYLVLRQREHLARKLIGVAIATIGLLLV